MPVLLPPEEPRHSATQKAYLIAKFAHDTAESLYEAYQAVRTARAEARGSRRGAPTDEEQDLLRAMVVFAGAGIDSMTKQLVHDALPVMVSESQDARARIERLGARHHR